MSFIGSATFGELEAVLARHHARLTASQVHALFLGAQTSTNPRLLPQHLLDRIFGEEVDLAETHGDAMELLGVLFGYWNHLIARRDAGEVALAPLDLPERATREQLREFAERRHGDLLWFIRGIDAGGDDPLEFGSEGQAVLKRIAEASGFMRAYADLLKRQAPSDESALITGRKNLLMLVATVEAVIADLMVIGDGVRRLASDTWHANAGRMTDDGTRIARPARVPRNAPCPCGSGKKWKKCCGLVDPLH